MMKNAAAHECYHRARRFSATVACAVVALACATTLHAQSCTPPPDGLIAWYPEDDDLNDLTGAHSPSATNAVRFTNAEVADGFDSDFGSYIDIPQTPGFAPQQFTIDAWVRPEGPGPNEDGFGSVICTTNINRLNGVQDSFSLKWV